MDELFGLHYWVCLETKQTSSMGTLLVGITTAPTTPTTTTATTIASAMIGNRTIGAGCTDYDDIDTTHSSHDN